MRFEFICAWKAQFPVTVMCSVLEVSRAGYYAWCNRGKSDRELDDEQLLASIRMIHAKSRETYGSPRIHQELVKYGVQVGENRVARLMRENDIKVRPRRGYRVSTTKSDPANEVTPNTLDRDFTATAPNQKWVTDVTFIQTDENWLYLAVILDLFNREVVGWAMGKNNDTALTLRALDMALSKYAPTAGLIHHSDRGSTYTCKAYRDALKDNGIECSMSRRANCWDNAVAESFFATLKKELVHKCHFETRKEASTAIFEYIELFYNRVRSHSVLNYVSPIEFRELNDA